MTGGKLASTLVSIPGASAYFKGSIVSYSEETKIKLLGVSKETIDKYSVVSNAVALEMARGVKEKLAVNYAISITGNAGPTTDVTDKTIGAVCIALVSDENEQVFEFSFGQPREKVINRTVSKAMEIIQKELLKKLQK
ncbi:UNVERIFIED_CONTAM: hypothetical protein GTU68_037197 [Idotea baltica]|nr:hypothetical protein [Idotea baltica]